MTVGPPTSVRQLFALALPPACAGCGAVDHAVCHRCRSALLAALWPAAREVSPSPRPKGLPPTHASGPYAGMLGRLAAAYKDDGRRDLREPLAALLARSVDAALAASPAALHVLRTAGGPVLMVPVPSSRRSRRRRGDAPLAGVARSAVREWGREELRYADLLRQRRRVADQAGLTAVQRAANLEHAMEVRGGRAGAAQGAVCLVVDDVLTTGATLVEARRALLAAGASAVLAATVCATARRSSGSRGLLGSE